MSLSFPEYRDPSRLLEVLGIDEPEDIHIEAVAQFCRATILYEPLQGSEARLLGVGENAIITVDSQTSPQRQRFSAAHELGHWMWDRGKMAFQCGESQLNGDQDSTERRANRYAVELLLPARMFLQKWAGRSARFETIQEIAALFRTSLLATAIRLVELSPEALELHHDDGKRKWVVRGPGVREMSEQSEIVDTLRWGSQGTLTLSRPNLRRTTLGRSSVRARQEAGVRR